VLEFTVSTEDLFQYVFVINTVSMSCVQLELCQRWLSAIDWVSPAD